MTVGYKYEMRFTAEKIANIIEGAIGRRPEIIGASGNRGMSFTFKGTDISQEDKQLALAALPPFVKDIYSFSRTIIEIEE